MPTTALVFSSAYAAALSSLPVHSNRDCMTFSLLQHTGLLAHVHVIAPDVASPSDLKRFHSSDYVDALKAETSSAAAIMLEHGLVDDAYAFPGLFSYCSYVAGASLTASKLLVSGSIDIAINWGGGRHHAKKDHASGFCYVNDVVLAVDYLLHNIHACKVLVIDIDVHHGDGVEEAFYFSSQVFTLSFHKFARGFFPGTGSPSSIGRGAGRHRNLNVPLDDGITDNQFFEVFEVVVQAIVEAFMPTHVVMTCGVDTLATDPLGTFNLTATGLCWCLDVVKELELPLLLLGGGGYNESDAARCFAALTATAIDQMLPDQVSDHDYFPMYGPHFGMATAPVKARVNKNTVASLEATCQQALKQIGRLRRREDAVNSGGVASIVPTA
ncbi:hypothetical protein H310_07583 [Aphanomyces invadans]|uniref:Histone deacetylase n=1 Tax=Aphanomyces invadans TaxID=157072 RepID=A0A024U3H9_9STRA|nr:hypothetical protein H310_07583 [Aphanomyces invadans]ETW00183.1 hypothetical protein H310_07583 [Aphanomyces invadans]|eukprot:XP_008871208.1 hypothetical protein H310_07583 [Aphanomyces invadans]